jgi:prevent-host-death family protein
MTMQKRYSIAQARDNLAAILHSLAGIKQVEITRRGQPVAVLISIKEYERLHGAKIGFWQSYKAYRKSVDLADLDIDPQEIFARVRDRSPGRDVGL